MANEYFGNLFKAGRSCSLEAQLKTVKHFLVFFDQFEGEKLGEKVTLKEIEEALKLFKKEKSLGPDGWTLDLFIHLFDIMGNYIL